MAPTTCPNCGGKIVGGVCQTCGYKVGGGSKSAPPKKGGKQAPPFTKKAPAKKGGKKPPPFTKKSSY